MHLLFLDESGQLAERKFFALGGIALRDSDWPFLRELWQSTLAEHGWPADREVKWHGIRTGEIPPALADAVVSALGAGAGHLLRHAARDRAGSQRGARVLRHRRRHLRHRTHVPRGAVPASSCRRGRPRDESSSTAASARTHADGSPPVLRGRRAGRRPGARLPQDTAAPVRVPSSNRRTRRGRDQTLPGAGSPPEEGDPAVRTACPLAEPDFAGGTAVDLELARRMLPRASTRPRRGVAFV